MGAAELVPAGGRRRLDRTQVRETQLVRVCGARTPGDAGGRRGVRPNQFWKNPGTRTRRGLFLERVCAGRLDVPVGRTTYTPVLNDRGYESDVVVMRLREDAYLIVTGSAQQARDLDLLGRRIRPDEFVTLTDMTSAYAVIGVMGPNARALLSRLGPTDLSNKAFPYMTHQEVEIGDTVARASRISYVGELGWELYVPSEAALPLYDRIRDAGGDLWAGKCR